MAVTTYGGQQKIDETPSQDIDLINDIKTMFQDAREFKRPLVTRWNKNRKIMRNKTWPDGRAMWMPSPEIPEIYPIIAASVGWMTDQRPSLGASAGAPPNDDFAAYYNRLGQDMTTCLQTAWHIYSFDQAVERVIWDAFVCGIGFFKSVWDGSLSGGIGDIKLSRVDPFTLYIDPIATCLEDANYIIEAKNISLQELDRRFPGKGKKFEEGGYRESIDEAEDLNNPNFSFIRANPGQLNNPAGAFGLPVQATGSTRYGPPGKAKMHATRDQGVTYYECWLREHYEEGPEDDKVLIDTWRVICVVGDQILMNERAENLWSHARHPYSRFVLVDEGMLYGTSMVELLAPSQLSINRLLASLQHNIELTGNPVFVEEARAGISRTTLTNQPGQRLKINSGGEVKWLNPPNVHPMMGELIQFYINEMERISGLSAMQRGMTPAGRNAQGVLEAVQEAGFVRIRLALRNLERALKDAGQLLAALVAEFYSSPRMVQIVGPNHEQSVLALFANHFYTAEKPSDRIPLKFNILIDANSMLPTSRGARIAEADALYAMGAIDDIAVLEAHEFPNREVVAQRVQQAKASGMMEPPTQRAAARR